MSIDQSTGIPFLFGEEPEEDRRKRKIVLAGGVMDGMGGLMGSPMGPIYPVLLDPTDAEEEKDPNP